MESTVTLANINYIVTVFSARHREDNYYNPSEYDEALKQFHLYDETDADTILAVELISYDWSKREETRIAFRSLTNELREEVKALENAYGETVTKRPEDTLAAWMESGISQRAAEIVLASCVNAVGDWDARISSSARRWAQNVPGALQRDAAIDRGIFTDRIHRAHLDQLAHAWMKNH